MIEEGSVEQLQIKIAFLEGAMAELSDVVFSQQRDIQTLQVQLRELRERLSAASAAAEETPRLPEQERPPHY